MFKSILLVAAVYASTSIIVSLALKSFGIEAGMFSYIVGGIFAGIILVITQKKAPPNWP